MTNVKTGTIEITWDELWQFFSDLHSTYVKTQESAGDWEGLTLRYCSWIASGKRGEGYMHPTPLKAPKHVEADELAEALEEEKRDGIMPRIPQCTDKDFLSALNMLFLVFNYIWNGWHGIKFEWADSQKKEGMNAIPYDREADLIER